MGETNSGVRDILVIIDSDRRAAFDSTVSSPSSILTLRGCNAASTFCRYERQYVFHS